MTRSDRFGFFLSLLRRENYEISNLIDPKFAKSKDTILNSDFFHDTSPVIATTLPGMDFPSFLSFFGGDRTGWVSLLINSMCCTNCVDEKPVTANPDQAEYTSHFCSTQFQTTALWETKVQNEILTHNRKTDDTLDGIQIFHEHAELSLKKNNPRAEL